MQYICTGCHAVLVKPAQVCPVCGAPVKKVRTDSDGKKKKKGE